MLRISFNGSGFEAPGSGAQHAGLDLERAGLLRTLNPVAASVAIVRPRPPQARVKDTRSRKAAIPSQNMGMAHTTAFQDVTSEYIM